MRADDDRIARRLLVSVRIGQHLFIADPGSFGVAVTLLRTLRNSRFSSGWDVQTFTPQAAYRPITVLGRDPLIQGFTKSEKPSGPLQLPFFCGKAISAATHADKGNAVPLFWRRDSLEAETLVNRDRQQTGVDGELSRNVVRAGRISGPLPERSREPLALVLAGNKEVKHVHLVLHGDKPRYYPLYVGDQVVVLIREDVRLFGLGTNRREELFRTAAVWVDGKFVQERQDEAGDGYRVLGFGSTENHAS